MTARIEDGGPAGTDRPILFSAPMVRALLAGKKTQTRRVVPAGKVYDDIASEAHEDFELRGWLDCSHGDRLCAADVRIKPGDRLWVREAWRTQDYDDHYRPSLLAADTTRWRYEADGELSDPEPVSAFGKLRPSLFMPRWASRLTLVVTDVRVERLQDITVDDAAAEGIERFATIGGTAWRDYGGGDGFNVRDPGGPARRSYASLWNHINGPGAWEANPWVAAYTFTVERCNIDAARQMDLTVGRANNG